jgi:hypothetical protein
VVEWLDGVDEDRVFLSVASLAEIRRGIEMMAEGRRRDHFEELGLPLFNPWQDTR